MDQEISQSAKVFTDLRVWQKGHKIVLHIYKITKSFPREEQYGLVSQLQRAAVSITSNIAEGFGRFGDADKRRFYVMAYGSLIELHNQVLIARDIQYITAEVSLETADMIVDLQKPLSKLIKACL